MGNPLRKRNSVVLLLFLACACTDLSEVYVDASAAGPGNGSPEYPFQRIGQGLFWVLPGGTVHVAEGQYHENLVIERPVRLIGAGSTSTRILADITKKGIEIASDDVEVWGFSISGIGEPDPGDIFVGGIWAENVDNIVVTENVIGPYAVMGIGIGNASNISVENNEISEIAGLWDSENQGIVIVLAQEARVRGNTVSHVDGFGITFTESAGDLEDNAVANCPGGIMLSRTNLAEAEVAVRGNHVQGSSHGGMALFASTLSEFYENTIVANPGFGLEIYDETTSILACGSNTISGNNPDFGEYLQYYGFLPRVLLCLQ
jgi:nitrous oxidase accessory protein